MSTCTNRSPDFPPRHHGPHGERPTTDHRSTVERINGARPDPRVPPVEDLRRRKPAVRHISQHLCTDSYGHEFAIPCEESQNLDRDFECLTRSRAECLVPIGAGGLLLLRREPQREPLVDRAEVVVELYVARGDASNPLICRHPSKSCESLRYRFLAAARKCAPMRRSSQERLPVKSHARALTVPLRHTGRRGHEEKPALEPSGGKTGAKRITRHRRSLTSTAHVA